MTPSSLRRSWSTTKYNLSELQLVFPHEFNINSDELTPYLEAASTEALFT
jgi:hypothetical protein